MKSLLNLSLIATALSVAPLTANAFFCGSSNKGNNQQYSNYQPMSMPVAYTNQGQPMYMMMPRPPIPPTPPARVGYAQAQPMMGYAYQQPQAMMPMQQQAAYLAVPAQASAMQQKAPAKQQSAAMASPQATTEKNSDKTFSPSLVQVSINQMKFQPAILKIKAGDSVEWMNMSQMPHTVTSTSDKTLASGQMGNGGKFKHSFTKPGTYTYQCAIHPSMTGQVVVE